MSQLKGYLLFLMLFCQDIYHGFAVKGTSVILIWGIPMVYLYVGPEFAVPLLHTVVCLVPVIIVTMHVIFSLFPTVGVVYIVMSLMLKKTTK